MLVTGWLLILAVYGGCIVVANAAMAILSLHALREGAATTAVPIASMDVAAIIVAHDEARLIPATLETLCRQSLRLARIVVVDDGSSDGTADVARETLAGLGRADAVVESVPHGGKAAGIAAGLRLVEEPLVCLVDADSSATPDAIAELAAQMSDQRVRAVSSWVVPRVPAGVGWFASALVVGQIVEYARGILWRTGFARLGALSNIEGRLGLFPTDVLRGLGLDDVREAVDYAISVGIHRAFPSRGTDGAFAIAHRAVVCTDVPHRLSQLVRQRFRWVRGLRDEYWRNRGLAFDARAGRVGTIEFPLRVAMFPYPLAELAILVCGCVGLAVGDARFILLAGAYFGAMLPLLCLALYCSRRYTIMPLEGRRLVLTVLALPLVAVIWEPAKGVVWLAAVFAPRRSSSTWSSSSVRSTS